MGYVVSLDDADGQRAQVVGGKGANLGRLRAVGLPVPAGFCVTTDAYRTVVGPLLDQLFEPLSRVEGDELAGLAQEARSRVLAAPVSTDVEQSLLGHYVELGRPAVAVRSSATAEDLDFASFAGQQDTFLNVLGTDALLAAVRRCWASLWTDRAVSYRNTAGIDHAGVALAVVVQEMVQSASAGVMFTANPVTGTRRQSVIDASPGLGEAVVSGAVNPDHFVVDTSQRRILERRVGDKRVLIRSLTGGGTERLERPPGSDPTLSDEQVLALAELGQRVEDSYGEPQDTEWAIDSAGELWLTQARPITTLYPLASTSQQGLRLHICLTLAQGLTRPITPMGLAAFRAIGTAVASAAGVGSSDPGAGPAALSTPGQRAFVDATQVFRSRTGRRLMLAALSVMEARTATVLQRLAEQPEFAVRTAAPWSTLRPVARVLGRVRLPQRALVAMISPRRAHRAIDELEVQLRQDLAKLSDLAPERRLDASQRLLAERVIWFMPTVVSYALPGFAMLALARRLLRGALQPGELQAVLRGLPHNPTTEMDLALWRLRDDISTDAAARTALLATPRELAVAYQRRDLPPTAQRGLETFLARYGHRAVAEIDVGMPRWSDDPTHLLGVIANYLRQDAQTLAADAQFEASRGEAEEVVARLVARAGQRSRIRAAVVQFALSRTRQLAGLREAPKNLAVLALAGVRHQLQIVGRALAEAGRIAEPDDIFFLDLTEARRAVSGEDLRALVTERKAAYDAELKRRHIPRLLLSDGTEPEAAALGDVAPGALVGSPASAGTVTAPARVVLDPVGARLEPGEILVAPSTDPGWTPLFLTAGGLVMEMGGSNSHGAVVAREYGIPAVVGVPDATSRITSGTTVTVDGAAGSVLCS